MQKSFLYYWDEDILLVALLIIIKSLMISTLKFWECSSFSKSQAAKHATKKQDAKVSFVWIKYMKQELRAATDGQNETNKLEESVLAYGFSKRLCLAVQSCSVR